MMTVRGLGIALKGKGAGDTETAGASAGPSPRGLRTTAADLCLGTLALLVGRKNCGIVVELLAVDRGATLEVTTRGAGAAGSGPLERPLPLPLPLGGSSGRRSNSWWPSVRWDLSASCLANCS